MSNIVERIVPVSDFNKGKAGRIFSRLEKEGEIIVVKNNRPAAVVVSPARWKMLVAGDARAELLKAAGDVREGKLFRAGTNREDIETALFGDAT